MKEISSRQMAIMVFITTCALKLVTLPSLIIGTAQNASWLCFVLMLVLDGAFLMLILSIMKRFPDKSFKQILEQFCGKVVTSIILFLLGILLAVKIAMITRECYEFYTETCYVDFSWLTFLLPILLVSSYLATKRLRSLARTGEILIFFVVLCTILALLFSFGSADIFSFLPFLPQGTKPVFKACFDNSLWFGDFLVLFFCMGNVKFEKHTIRNVALSYLTAMLIVISVAFIQFSLYGVISSAYKTSIVDITEYIPRLSTTSRFTWVVVFLWPVSMLYTIFCYSHFAVDCFRNCFQISVENNKYVSYVAVALSLGLLLSSGFSLINLIGYTHSFIKYFVFAVQYVLMVLLPFALIKNIKGESDYEKKPLEK